MVSCIGHRHNKELFTIDRKTNAPCHEPLLNGDFDEELQQAIDEQYKTDAEHEEMRREIREREQNKDNVSG